MQAYGLASGLSEKDAYRWKLKEMFYDRQCETRFQSELPQVSEGRVGVGLVCVKMVLTRPKESL